MALKSIVLHLGAHKTATSLIQKFMRDNTKLCEGAGLVAPRRSDTDRLIRWGRPADIAAGRDELRERIAKADRDGAEHFVLSHENSLGRPFTTTGGRLYPDAEARAAEIHGVLADLPLTIILYVREAVSFVESYYLQTVQEGGIASFSKWFGSLNDPSLSWSTTYDDLCGVFGAKSVYVRSFDNEVVKGQSGFLAEFFSMFTSASSEKFGNFKYKPVQNASIGDKGLELALTINPFLDTSGERKLVRKFLQEHYSNQTYPRPKLFSPREKKEIARMYEGDIDDVLGRSDRAVSA